MTPLSQINCPDPVPAGTHRPRKAPFVMPRLTCYGAVVDLTQQFGGSMTPEEREERGLDY
jgi:hypothetical protein